MCVCVCFSQMFVKAICLDQMEDGIYVRLARTAVVIRAGAEPAGSLSLRAPVQRIARHPTNRQLEIGEGNQPVGRAPVQCNHQPPRPVAADREPEEQAQQEEEAPRQEKIEVVESDSSSSEEEVQKFSYEILLERIREEAARESEERKARRARQESGVSPDVSEEQEQKRRRQEGQPTRSRAAHYDSVAID